MRYRISQPPGACLSEVEWLTERAGLSLLSVEPPEAHGPHLARGKGQVASGFVDLRLTLWTLRVWSA